MSTAITTRNSTALVAPEDPIALGAQLYKSGLFPDVKKAEQAVVKVLAGREFGIGPVASMTGVHVIDGKPSLGANLLAGQVKASPHYDYEVRERTDTGCEIEFFELSVRTGKWQSVGSMEFAEADAKRAGLLGRGNWRKFPRDMYFARALTAGVRTYCPDLLAGAPAYTPEELAPDVDMDENGAPTTPVVPVDPVEVVDAEPVPEEAPSISTDQLRALHGLYKKAGWSQDELHCALVGVGIDREKDDDLKASMQSLTLAQYAELHEMLGGGELAVE